MSVSKSFLFGVEGNIGSVCKKQKDKNEKIKMNNTISHMFDKRSTFQFHWTEYGKWPSLLIKINSNISEYTATTEKLEQFSWNRTKKPIN